MKILCFWFRGQLYKIDESGRINANGINHYSDDWIFLGVSSHHWHNHITVTLKQGFKNPSLLNGCLGWDKDHGTTRRWSGRYCGKLPRIKGAHIRNEN